MSIFKKKKDPVEEMKNTLKGYNMETEKQVPTSRSASVKVAKEAKDSQRSKDELLEKLTDLRKIIWGNSAFDKYVDKIEEICDTLKDINDNPNKAAVLAVDSLLMENISAAVACCRKKAGVALGATLGAIEELIGDRESCGNYYTNDKFIKTKKEILDSNKNLQIQKANLKRLQKEAESLKADYEAATSKADKEEIIGRVAEIKSETAGIRNTISLLSDKITLLKDNLNKIMADCATDSIIGYDIETDTDAALEAGASADDKHNIYTKLHDKHSVSHRSVSSSELGVDGGSLESSSNSPAEVNSDYFDV